MRPLRETLGLADAPTPSLAQVVDALILLDSPILDQRFKEAIAMHPDAKTRAVLSRLPERVAEGSRMTRRAGIEWERIGGGTVMERDFRQRAERFLLEALLESAETQIQLKTFMSAHAPTREVRGLIDDAIGVHRELTHALREAIGHLDGPFAAAPPAAPEEYVGFEEARGDLRGQVERAIRTMRGKGHQPRALVLSANALRHLRDQGLFPGGGTTVLDVPVRVDMTWPGSSFALLSFENVSLDEMADSLQDG